jgi:putative CocE/NonD family hydrolase
MATAENGTRDDLPGNARRAYGSSELFSRIGSGKAPEIERMPTPDLRIMLPMRDGVRLDTWVWLPTLARQGGGRVPAILLRTPYREEVIGWARLRQMRYVDEGYALVYQMIRGTGNSEGTFEFSAPHEKTDGFDAVEWTATQPWCDGNVGMDGASYLAMTQLAAAAARPPHLRCIAPHVPSAFFFREPPYVGGAFSRQHTLNWTNLISVSSLAELTGGWVNVMPLLAQPEWLERIMKRPVKVAADDLLAGDKLAHYRDVLDHPTFDDWWRERTLGPEDYAAMDLPTLLVTGVFDMSVGTMTVWHGLAKHASCRADRQLLIGPWDHGQCYVGGAERYGPFELGVTALADPFPIRLAFFDKHLKGKGDGPQLGGKTKIYITGRNAYRSFSAFPPVEAAPRSFFLTSSGHANTLRGDGRLLETQPQSAAADRTRSDPRLPFVASITDALALKCDAREDARHGETLVYVTDPLAAPLTVVGEPEVRLHVSADAPDADVAVQICEIRPDGAIAKLSWHALRLRYREGFDREVLLSPGRPVEASIVTTFMAHEFAAGTRIALLVRPDMFPFLDPNPHTGEPIASAMDTRPAELSVLHGDHPSRLILPVLED